MKTIFLSISLLCSAVFNQVFSSDTTQVASKDERSGITMLIVNADVTVVLVGSDKAYVHADGDGAFINDLEIKQSGDTIMINSKRRKDLKARGIVFIPASQLKRIKINSGAHVRSLNTLQIPKLDVVINGACILAVSNIGALNLIETDDYSFEQTSEVRYWPSKVFLNN